MRLLYVWVLEPYTDFHSLKAIQKTLTLTVLVTTIDALGHFETGNYSTVRGDGGSRAGKVRAGTTSPMPEHKGFMLQ